MPRPALVTDSDLVARLSDVFRAEGFEGASLVALSRASGLQRASLYHRFPGGKEQMAQEVLRTTQSLLDKNILEMLHGNEPPPERAKELVRQLDAFYNGGKKNCVLNMLVSSTAGKARHNKLIGAMAQEMLAGLAKLVADAGFDKDVAKSRAERAMALLEGSLVMCRSLGVTAPFANMLRQLPQELLGK